MIAAILATEHCSRLTDEAIANGIPGIVGRRDDVGRTIIAKRVVVIAVGLCCCANNRPTDQCACDAEANSLQFRLSFEQLTSQESGKRDGTLPCRESAYAVPR